MPLDQLMQEAFDSFAERHLMNELANCWVRKKYRFRLGYIVSKADRQGTKRSGTLVRMIPHRYSD